MAVDKQKKECCEVLIIGGGVTGAATAYALSRYDLQVMLAEKNADFAFGVTKANSGIVHAGFHHDPGSLKARLEVQGNRMFDELQRKLKFPFRRNGILVAAFGDAEMAVVRWLYERGLANGVPGLELCDGPRMRQLEPKLNPEVTGGLFAPTGGVVEPYAYTFALMEAAALNGVETRTEFAVSEAVHDGETWEVKAADGRTVRARYVVNAAGLYADEVSARFGGESFTIRPRKGEEYLLDRTLPLRPEHVIFPVPMPNSKGTLVIPTAEGTTMIGPTAEMVDDKTDDATSDVNLQRILQLANRLIPGITARSVITAFSGLRPTLAGDDFFIAPSQTAPHFIQAAGIQSPGLTASPAIGDYVRDLLRQQGVAMREKSGYRDILPDRERIREATPEHLAELIARNPAYGRIVCRCENVSEAEIVEAIRHGHTTLDGVKFYTRAGMGRCQGGFCSGRIIEIIHRETGIPVNAITKHGGTSRILLGRLDMLDRERRRQPVAATEV